MRFITRFFIGCLIVISGCNLLFPKKKLEPTSNAPLLYQASELALLMRKMNDDGVIIKKNITAGTWPVAMPNDYNQMLTAKATDPADINDTYKAFSAVYLANYDSLKTATIGERTEKFNNLINSCISCHQVFCVGPIPKIQSLLLN